MASGSSEALAEARAAELREAAHRVKGLGLKDLGV